MGLSLGLDRFEGHAKEIAVLVDDDGQQFNVPRSLLPADATPGWVFTCSFQHDPDATSQLAMRAQQLQTELRKTDPGGDIHL